ncbi:hypothetical protein [Streptomyces sp. NPDC046870]|uniref:HoxN/HupN/NixA family nickel/cobalt transporter n=1 Tax=Streptomyces sp. NPDC046870 TaxID=3155135 RepID=UPI0034533E41
MATKRDMVVRPAHDLGGLPAGPVVQSDHEMTHFDTLDGAFMSAAYRWAFVHPLRRIHYNLTTTGLSAAAALLVGAVNLMTSLRSRVPAVERAVPWPAGVDLDGVGYLIGGLFLAAWTGSFLYWKAAGRSGGLTLPDRSPDTGHEGRSAASVL